MPDIHLLVLVHGMWGNPSHLAQLEKLASKKPGIHVLVPHTNAEDSTYDGIDWGGERVSQEILGTVAKLAKEGKTVTKFSITGYSLGGLVSRYAIGILYQRGFFDDVLPVNFNTIATPHLGLPKYPDFFSKVGGVVGPRLLSRTGEQFYCVDKWSGSKTGRPLLEVMADPKRVFHQALSKFQEIRIYANAVYDRTVPYVTAAIELDDPFINYTTNNIEITFHEEYPNVIKSYSIPLAPSSSSSSSSSSLSKTERKVPPLLPFGFPVNVAVYALLPLLLPAVAAVAIVKFTQDSKKSRARIKLLEQGHPSLAKMLLTMEEGVNELATAVGHGDESRIPTTARDVDSPPDSPTSSSPVLPLTPNPTDTTHHTRGLHMFSRHRHRKCQTESEVLSPLQKEMAGYLNMLPIKKEIAFLDAVANSHGSIIMRDLERFSFQKCGEGLVRRWGDMLQT